MTLTTLNPVKLEKMIPHDVLNYITNKYPGSTILNVEEDIDYKDRVTMYYIEIADTENTFHLKFDGTGKFVEHDLDGRDIHMDGTDRDPNVMESKPASATEQTLDEF
jgi:hypothetical protein